MHIYGGGFSEDVFNFGKPKHGNKVCTHLICTTPELCTRCGLPMTTPPWSAGARCSGTSSWRLHRWCRGLEWCNVVSAPFTPQDSSGDRISCSLPARYRSFTLFLFLILNIVCCGLHFFAILFDYMVRNAITVCHQSISW